MLLYLSDCNNFVIFLLSTHLCTRSLMDRTEASDAFNAGSIPAGCICFLKGVFMENQNRKDKVGGGVKYLKVHLTNLFLMCKENRKTTILTAVFLAVVIVALALSIMAEKKSTTTAVIVPEDSSIDAETEVVAVPEEALEKDAYPEVNNLIKQYYQALVEGDMETIRSIKSSVDDKEEITIVEKSAYIEAYPMITVYTKKGPVEGSFVAYVHYEVKFLDHDITVPGVNPLYICQREDGSYFINEDVDAETVEYIKTVTAHNDVIDLYNTVQVQYNEVLTQNEELSAFLTQLPERLKESVSLALAKKEAESAPEEPEEVAAAAEEITVVTKVKATDVVNVRSSDSVEADRVGKTTQGQILDLLEERVNGWSKVEFEGKEGFIKSEFLEPEETMVVSAEEAQAAQEETSDSTSENGETTKGTLTDTVNVRRTAGTDGDKLGQLAEGSTVEILEKLSSGWTKIKYNDGEAYVKSDFVE